MLRRPAFFLAFLLALPLAAQNADDLLRVSYVVEVADPQSGSISVTMTVHNCEEEEARVAIPAWAPGAYRIANYAKDVKNVRARGKDGERVAVLPVDHQTWRVKAGKGRKFTVLYELAVEKLRMDKAHCYLAGPDTYFYVVGRKDAPCRVRFKIPVAWNVGTGLRREGEEYAARDYDTFIDCPTELGEFELLRFEEDKAKYELVIHSVGPVNGERLVEMCRKIVKEQNRMFGGPPFDRYLFLYHFTPRVGGSGLEHLNSTNITLHYPAIKAEPLLAASVTSHEYFHLWNVKRIRPFELGPFDYAKAVKTKALWFCEGVTSYFGDRTLARCGIWSDTTYLSHLATEIETLQNNPDRKATSAERASEWVWDRRDWPRVDYYNKGELLGLLIDLRIRAATEGKKSFDDVLRHLYHGYCVKPARDGKGEIGVGFPEDGLLKALEEVSGLEWGDFYGKYIKGVEELPYEEVLGAAGLSVTLTVARMPDLGVSLRGTSVVSVPPLGEAQTAGLQEGDRITSLNDVEVTRSTIQTEISKHKGGETVPLKVLRNGETVDLSLKLGVRERSTCKLKRAESATESQKRLLNSWLRRDFGY